MLDGMWNWAKEELSGLPLAVPSEESSTPFLPIRNNTLPPSWVNFWTTPDGAEATQKLFSLSKWQLWSRGSSKSGLLHECTRSEEHTSELQSHLNLLCRLLLLKKIPGAS